MTVGHFIYECKGTRPYLSRPSRTQQLENPRLLAKLKADGKPSIEVPEEFKQPSVVPAIQITQLLTFTSSFYSVGTANKILEAREKERSKEEKGKEKDSSPKRKKAKRSVCSPSSCLKLTYYGL